MMKNFSFRLIVSLACWQLIEAHLLDQFKTGFEQDEHIKTLLHCLYDVKVNEIDMNRDNLLINFKANDRRIHYKLGDMVERLLGHHEVTSVHIGFTGNVQKYYNLPVHIILVDSVQAFGDIVERQQFQNLHYFVIKYMIVLMQPAGFDLEPLSDISKIFSILFDMFILNVNIAVPTEKGAVNIYGYWPYTAFDCKSTKPILKYVYKKGVNLKALFKANKFNFNGCALTVLTAHEPPYVMLSGDTNQSSRKIVSGIEGEVIRQMALALNFTIETMVVEEGHKGHALKNGSATGVYNTLLERGANITLGDCTCSPNRMLILASTESYLQSKICIVLKAAKHYTPIEVLFHPFDQATWWLIFGICCLRYSLISFLWTFTRRSPRPFRRFMLAMWLLSMLYLRNAYESSYFNFMSKRPPKPLPDDIEDLRAEGYRIISDRLTSSFINYYGEINDMLVINRDGPERTYRKLEKLKGRYGALTKTEYLAYYLNKFPHKRAIFHIVYDSIVVDITCMFFARFSYLVSPFNELLSDLRSFGLLDAYYGMNVNRKALPTVRQPQSLQLEPSYELEGLRYSKLSGVFSLLWCCWCLDIVVFIIELLSMKFEFLRRLLDKLY